MVPLQWYLLVGAALFSIGLYGVLARRNAIAILMSIELMLNAVNINLVAFWRYLNPTALNGQAFAVFVFAVAAAEAAVGLALILSIYRNRRTVIAEDVDHHADHRGGGRPDRAGLHRQHLLDLSGQGEAGREQLLESGRPKRRRLRRRSDLFAHDSVVASATRPRVPQRCAAPAAGPS